MPGPAIRGRSEVPARQFNFMHLKESPGCANSTGQRDRLASEVHEHLLARTIMLPQTQIGLLRPAAVMLAELAVLVSDAQ